MALRYLLILAQQLRVMDVRSARYKRRTFPEGGEGEGEGEGGVSIE